MVSLSDWLPMMMAISALLADILTCLVSVLVVFAGEKAPIRL
jgi:hypothetical protein